MLEMNYDELMTEIEGIFKGNNEIVLSTCVENKVTSRTMSYIYFNRCFYFLTHAKSMKSKQIQKNSRVSLCLNNIQIEGTAAIKGHPLIESNKTIGEIFKKSFDDYFKRFAHRKNAVFIEVTISDIKIWKLEDNKDYFYFLDISEGKAIRK